MDKIIFNCKIITPLFMSGADSSKLEIRPPSIKGLIRFWWRAMHGELSLQELRKYEGKIFGSVDDNPRRSNILLKTKGQPNNNDVENNPQRLSSNINTDYPGIKYLLYSVLSIKKQPYIKPGFGFTLELCAKDKKVIEEAVHAFWCLTFFGALGSRSRRGAGCIKATTGSPEYKNMFDTSHINNKNQLKIFIESGLKRLELTAGNTSYSTLKGSKIYILDPQKSWQDAMEYIGSSFKKFRSDNKSRITEMPNFGFPIRHRNKTVMVAGFKNHNIKKLSRRASPLIIKIINTGDNYYFPVVIWLNGNLIPDSYLIMDRYGGNKASPSNRPINEFLEKLDDKKLVIRI
jgi:CRISPR-associated protein Cmr1